MLSKYFNFENKTDLGTCFVTLKAIIFIYKLSFSQER